MKYFLVPFGHSVKVCVDVVLPDRGCTVHVVPPIANSSCLVEEGSIWTEKLVVATIKLTIVPSLVRME